MSGENAEITSSELGSHPVGGVNVAVVKGCKNCVRGKYCPRDSFEYIFKDRAICFRLFAQDARRAASRARARAGRSIAARIPMMAMTTSNSIRVNPCLRFMGTVFLIIISNIINKLSF